jgi:hypothetical protein
MSKSRVAFIQRVFGDLRWNPEYQWWATESHRPSGEVVGVAILNDAFGPRRRRVERAARLFLRAMEAEPRVLREAMNGELLDHLNASARQAGNPELIAAEWVSRLRLEFAGIYWCVPLSLTYDANAVAQGRKVSLKLDENLRLLNAALT